MITVVCLSPSVDRTIELSSLCVGGTNRALSICDAAGGKGVNVAMTLKAMGKNVRLAVYRHAHGAQPLMDALKHAGIDAVYVDTPGALRVNLKLMDLSMGKITEVNASAPPVPEKAQQAMESAVVASARESEWLVLTGSMPAGYPADAYAKMIERVRREAPDCRIALDAEGDPLRLGVMEKPDFVKPNLHELQLLTGRALHGEAEIAAAAKAMVDGGVKAVLVSMDEAGSLLAVKEGMFAAQAVPVQVKTTVGAGDAMLSGYLCAWDQGPQAAMRYAVAAATARVAGKEGSENAYLPLVQMKAM